MPYDNLYFPVISPTSGPVQDGALLGKINQSAFSGAALAAKIIPIPEVRREDITATGSSIVDVTDAATNDTAGDFQPFGATADMSDGDAFFFHVGDEVCHKIYVQIATPGVGDWEIAIQRWDSSTESWVDMTITVDDSDNFRAAAGVYRIEATHSGSEGELKLHHTDTAKYRWHRVYVKNLTSVTTAPILTRIWAESPDYHYHDATSAVNTGDWSSFDHLGDFMPTVDDYVVYTHPGPPIGVDVNVSVAASGTYTMVREYLSTNNTWKTLPDLVDPSSDYTVTGDHKIRWSRPSDWVTKSHENESGTMTGWIERRRISAVTTGGPVPLPETRLHSRSLGADNSQGLELGPVTYSYATFSMGENRATVDTVLQLINSDTGATATITIPQAVDESSDIAGGRVSLSSALSFTSGQSLLVSCLSGGVLVDCKLRLHS